MSEETNPEVYAELEDGTVMANPDVVVPEGQVGVTDEQLQESTEEVAEEAPVERIDEFTREVSFEDGDSQFGRVPVEDSGEDRVEKSKFPGKVTRETQVRD